MARALLPELKRASADKAVEQEMRLNSRVAKQVKQVSTKPLCFMLNATVILEMIGFAGENRADEGVPDRRCSTRSR